MAFFIFFPPWLLVTSLSIRHGDRADLKFAFSTGAFLQHRDLGLLQVGAFRRSRIQRLAT
jgi:hypothetical protein